MHKERHVVHTRTKVDPAATARPLGFLFCFVPAEITARASQATDLLSQKLFFTDSSLHYRVAAPASHHLYGGRDGFKNRAVVSLLTVL